MPTQWTLLFLVPKILRKNSHKEHLQVWQGNIAPVSFNLSLADTSLTDKEVDSLLELRSYSLGRFVNHIGGVFFFWR